MGNGAAFLLGASTTVAALLVIYYLWKSYRLAQIRKRAQLKPLTAEQVKKAALASAVFGGVVTATPRELAAAHQAANAAAANFQLAVKDKDPAKFVEGLNAATIALNIAASSLDPRTLAMLAQHAGATCIPGGGPALGRAVEDFIRFGVEPMLETIGEVVDKIPGCTKAQTAALMSQAAQASAAMGAALQNHLGGGGGGNGAAGTGPSSAGTTIAGGATAH